MSEQRLGSLEFNHPTRRAKYLGLLFHHRYRDPSGEKMKNLAYRLSVEPINQNDDLYYIGPQLDWNFSESNPLFWGPRHSYHEYDEGIPFTVPDAWEDLSFNENKTYHAPVHPTTPLPPRFNFTWRRPHFYLRDIVEYNEINENNLLETKRGVITHMIFHYKEGRMPRELNQTDNRYFVEFPDEIVLGIVKVKQRNGLDIAYHGRQENNARRIDTPLGHAYFDAFSNNLREVGFHSMEY